jgi:sortase A
LSSRNKSIRQSIGLWLRRALFFAGVACLSYVACLIVDAESHQEYEEWRFNRAIRASAADAARTKVPSPIAQHIAPVSYAPGETIGRLEIARVGISTMIGEGTENKTLRRGVGHITGTPLPGETGNVAVAGHRDTFFRELRNVQIDDEIILTSARGNRTYRVDSIRIVDPDDVEVLNDSGEPAITLVTCYPFYFVGPARKRFIVRAHGS